MSCQNAYPPILPSKITSVHGNSQQTRLRENITRRCYLLPPTRTTCFYTSSSASSGRSRRHFTINTHFLAGIPVPRSSLSLLELPRESPRMMAKSKSSGAFQKDESIIFLVCLAINKSFKVSVHALRASNSCHFLETPSSKW